MWRIYSTAKPKNFNFVSDLPAKFDFISGRLVEPTAYYIGRRYNALKLLSRLSLRSANPHQGVVAVTFLTYFAQTTPCHLGQSVVASTPPLCDTPIYTHLPCAGPRWLTPVPQVTEILRPTNEPYHFVQCFITFIAQV